MFEWSKSIIDKLDKNEKLTEKELIIVECALRMYDAFDQVLDESTGCSDEDFFELKHKI